MGKIINNEVYKNGKIEVRVVKHFSRFEDCIRSEMIDFVFAVDISSGEIIIRTQKEFKKEFIGGLEKSIEKFFDSYISNGQYEPNMTTKEHFVNWFNGDYVLDIASDSSGIPVCKYLEYAPIYFDKKIIENSKKERK